MSDQIVKYIHEKPLKKGKQKLQSKESKSILVISFKDSLASC